MSKEWENDFSAFFKDMSPSYKDGLTIERVDNHLGYSKENCIWVDRKAQALNTRNIEKASRYEWQGKKYTVRELAEISKIKRTTMDMRLRKYKWTINQAMGV